VRQLDENGAIAAVRLEGRHEAYLNALLVFFSQISRQVFRYCLVNLAEYDLAGFFIERDIFTVAINTLRITAGWGPR